MEKIPQIPEHPGPLGRSLTGEALPELQLPSPTPEPEVGAKIPPDQLDDLVRNPEKQWEEDDRRKNKDKDTPTIH